jgi:hypothetical protein
MAPQTLIPFPRLRLELQVWRLASHSYRRHRAALRVPLVFSSQSVHPATIARNTKCSGPRSSAWTPMANIPGSSLRACVRKPCTEKARSPLFREKACAEMCPSGPFFRQLVLVLGVLYGLVAISAASLTRTTVPQYKIEGSHAPCGSLYRPIVIRVFRCWARNP